MVRPDDISSTSDSASGPIPLDGSRIAVTRLDSGRLEFLTGFGRTRPVASYVFAPESLDELRRVLQRARASDRCRVTLRGAGKSYGDAATNAEGVVVDLQRLRSIRSWDSERGIIDVEAGVTIGDVWKRTIVDGWWPPVVPGTMTPTIGGALAMNIHGKNAWKVGPIGEHVLAFDIMTADGSVTTCSPEENPDLFYSAIGGIGLLGVIVSARLQMRRVASGLLAVRASTPSSLEEMLDGLEFCRDQTDYLVGWIDATVRGTRLGRGVLHEARYLAPDEDSSTGSTLTIDAQTLPSNIFGLVPKSLVRYAMRPLINNAGLRLMNLAKFFAARLGPGGREYHQSLGAFSFLLDYVPEWEQAYGPGGLVQYQIFLPKGNAARVFRIVIEESIEAGLPAYLAVVKRHRSDRFLLTHGVDGFSLALDYKVSRRFRMKGEGLFRRFNRLVIENGGRFYAAKDAILTAEEARAFIGSDRLGQFARLKQKYDSDGIFESDLARRLFGYSRNSSPIFGQADR